MEKKNQSKSFDNITKYLDHFLGTSLCYSMSHEYFRPLEKEELDKLRFTRDRCYKLKKI